jgi:hypothetical protein
MTKLDPRSDAVVLTLTGEEGVPVAGAPDGTPARDLTEAAVARLVYERAYAAVALDVGQPIDPDDPEKGVIVRPDPRDPDPELAAAIIAELVATGGYAPVEAKTKKAKAKAQADAEAVAKAADIANESAGAAETPEA